MALQDDKKAIMFLSLFFIELFGRLGYKGIVFYDMCLIMSYEYWKSIARFTLRRDAKNVTYKREKT